MRLSALWINWLLLVSLLGLFLNIEMMFESVRQLDLCLRMGYLLV